MEFIQIPSSHHFRQLLKLNSRSRRLAISNAKQESRLKWRKPCKRVAKRGENVEILGPEYLVGYAGSVRGLQYIKSNDEQLASKAAVVLAHLSRFKHVRGLRAEASHKPPPFKITWDPNDHAQGVPFPNGQHFRFTFESKSNVDLYLTVMDFGPVFLIEQLYPQQDSAEKVRSRSTQSFLFKVEVPIKLKSDCLVGKGVTHRDIIRMLVTQGKELSWKSLQLPAIWNADQLQLGGGKSYGRDVTLLKSFPSVSSAGWRT
ncbi:hypothetical protein HIM_08386 [Hirsutella minnesotensis 3608]|uniref:Uncharacterized protein n=1 Tax=Hirsutella minnesotensis 3608 TaxID=1043627 RepID=A0A0F8A3Q6_9HYPO|nr:hypothetical protein HIM_08386 [Hirsutella minnesotensis 3608]